jgi:hypothetical protein
VIGEIMAYLIKVTYYKPSNVAWYTDSGLVVPLLNRLKNQEKERYKETGQLISETSDGPDENTYVYTALWISKSVYDEYCLSSAVSTFWGQQNSYNEENGITFIVENQEI